MIKIMCKNPHIDPYVNAYVVGEGAIHLLEAIQENSDVMSNIIRIYAYGPELEAIREQITSVPMVSGTGVHWFGDDAKFIIANLKL